MATSPLTLTSILNSLHTHLQNQIQLLPTLHAQLGLPATALAQELETLQQQLIDGVEAPIAKRRNEVEGWMERCNEIEESCVRYTKALGGNVKATGASVGELRKETVLPKRFQLVSEREEQLRRLYRTKLEQLSALTNRLSLVAKTLGSEYYTPDVLEPTLAPGEAPGNPNAYTDVCPDRFSRLEKELVRGKTELAKRVERLSRLFVDIDFLYTELGVVPPSLEDLAASASSASPPFPPTMSRATSSGIHAHGPVAVDSDPFLVSTPTPSSHGSHPRAGSMLFAPTSNASARSQECAYERIFVQYMLVLQEASDEDSFLPAMEGVDPTPGLLAWAQNTLHNLEATKRTREGHIQALYEQLEKLWRRLGVDEEDMDAFVDANKGSTEAVVREYECELERMLELKRERMGAFVQSARLEIETLWDELMMSNEECVEFVPFFEAEATEELLARHEEEIKRLKEEKRTKAPLLAMVKKHREIMEEERELAAAASDQTRLTGRGPRDPGRLLREEKMRKRVQKEKPRLEQDMLLSIPTWEEETGRIFLVDGQPYLASLQDIASATDQENVRRRGGTGAGTHMRTGSAPTRATTPANSRGNGNSVTPAIRSAPGSAQSAPSSKRQKLADGTPRMPLGTHRGENGTVSPPHSSKSSAYGGLGKTHATGLPRPKAGPLRHQNSRSVSAKVQHAALGHGRHPSTMSSRTVSASSTVGRIVSGGAGGGGVYAAQKASRQKRESFKPRPSMDAAPVMAMPLPKRDYGGAFVTAVKEEEEEVF